MAEQATKKKASEVPDYKLAQVKELTNLIDSKNTVMFTSIKSLPASQFQKIKKNLRNDAVVKVVKKRVLLRAIEESKKPKIKDLEKHVKEDCAVLISDLDAFELSGKLNESKSPVKAKVGQEAPNDIEIEAGTTDLPAGPAVSELGSVGLTVKVNEGKIEILESKVIAKTGQVITEEMAGVMSKLDILPFFVGFIPLVAYDSKSGLVFEDIVINKEAVVEDLQQSAGKALAFAVHMAYLTQETVSLLLGKAASHEKALGNLVKEESAEQSSEDKAEESGDSNEEKAEESEEKKEDAQTDKTETEEAQ